MTAKFLSKLAFLYVLFAILSGPAGSKTVNDNPPLCQGEDLLKKLKQSDSQTYAAIIGAAEQTLNGRSLFWKIEAPGLSTSYLLGTVHLTDNRVIQLSESIRSAFESSSVLALELKNLDNSALANNLGKLGQDFIFTDGKSLDQMLSPKEFQRAGEIVSRMGLPSKITRLLKPWFVTLFLAHPQCELERAKSGLPFLDKYLAEIARQRQIEVVGLETPEEQFNALASLPLEDQRIFLKESLRSYNHLDDINETMVQLYLARRIGAIWPLTVHLSRNPELTKKALLSIQQKLVIERNKTMRSRALPLLEKGNVFIAVGALHLPGKEGLVSLLKEVGYKVSPME